MSLVRLADSSTNTYGDPELYTLKSHSDSSSLSTQRENFDHQYFSDSIQYICQPNSGIPGNMLNPHRATSYHLMASSGSVTSHSVTDYLDGLSSDHGIIDCDEDDIRLKLQELERELLSDNNDDDDDVLGANQSMDIECEWADSIKNLILPNSPKESSSSDSNLSSISSNKDSAVLLPVSSPHSSQNLTPKQLLLECAATISEGNMDEASVTITKLRQMVSIQGDPPQRIAAYMVEGLAARMAASGLGLYKVLKCKEPPTSDRLSAMQILFEICPCFKFGFMAANGAILEASKDEDRIHIIDFDINQGSQYMTLIQDLATRPGKRPFMRVTGVDDPESVQRTVGGLKVIGHRLEKFAESVGVLFDFRAIAIKTEDVTPAMLDCRSNEALVVNFAFQLHHMPDESVSTVNQRDRLLRMVKSLEPKLVTVVEQDVNTNTAPFFPRFVEAYNYYSAVFESLDVTLPRESLDRMNVERQCLARDIVNIVACEGEDRFERYEVAGKWRARMMMAGFKSCPLSEHVNKTIRQLLKQYCDRYKVKEECGALHFGWEDKNLIVASTWR